VDNEHAAALNVVPHDRETQTGRPAVKPLKIPERQVIALAGHFVLRNGRGSVNGATIDNVIVVFASFTTDGSQEVLNPNSTYDDYMFILIRDGAGSPWTVDDCGY
jgi:hypothetical protein